jgi:hypothetical protein
MKIDPEYYDKDYFENGVCSGKSGYQGYNMEQGYAQLAKGLVTYFQPTQTLDIGCAKGYLVKCLRDLGISAYGIDISEYAISTVPKDIKDFVGVGSAIDLSRFGDKEFDLITCYDILEHITDEELVVAMKEIKRVSRGYVTIKCPFEHYDWDADKSHINIKPKEDWIKLFNKCGFDQCIPTVPSAPWAWNDDRRTLFFQKR